MKLSWVERGLMTNPIRGWIQASFEAGRLFSLGGRIPGHHALEIGCGQGAGIDILMDRFGAGRVDGFDLDDRMVRRARFRHRHRRETVSLWVGNACHIASPPARYDAVFAFGVLHHVVRWRKVLEEVRRVLKPGGRFYAEEILRRYLVHPLFRKLLDHPQTDRFTHDEFLRALSDSGLRLRASATLADLFAWYVADKPRG